MAQDRMEEQAVVQQESGPELLTLTSFYPDVSPRHLFAYWTQPALLQQWWPPEAEVNVRPGGAYCLSWPTRKWNLRGIYNVVEPGQRLTFTWKWGHEPDAPVREVAVAFEPVGDVGTQVTVTHGTYTNSSKDQDERDGHLEGWVYFLTRLHGAITEEQK
ncbi:MAG: SRPBCC domain-containing protein [Chloroflexota bacterium]